MVGDDVVLQTGPLNDLTYAYDRHQPDDAIGLCLSGGGYRAMLFHVGALWRLYDANLLKDIGHISSVSGGSITAARLALVWPKLITGNAPETALFMTLLADPVRGLARHTIDIAAGAVGILIPGAAGEVISRAYAKHLLAGATLQDLPDSPRFVFNATSLQSGVLWRFSKRYMADYRVGIVENPATPLSLAVAASSSFPPMLSPTYLSLDPLRVKDQSGADLHQLPYTKRAVLTDGGVYDNLGLETIWKRCRTILVSDGGARFSAEQKPRTSWPFQAYRVLNLIDSQVRSLRKRQLISSYEAGTMNGDHRLGTYWGIGTEIEKYAGAHFHVSAAETAAMAGIHTRLKRLPDAVQKRLINWGYAVTDAAIRTHWKPGLALPTNLPL